MREVEFEPPLALRQLAQITDFDLFVTTTFDPLLERAVNLERYGGQPTAEVIAYAPNRVADLPAERSQLQRAVVYHLLGRLSASPTYVVSDEDMLEFICALQSEHLTPEKLFHELEHNHLLLIGSDFSNWLARLFLRMAKRQRLSDPRDVGEVFADDHTLQDERLVAFLQQVSVRTRVYGGAEAFVAELHARWTKRQGGAAAPVGSAASPQRFLPPAREMPEHAVFISYAREDLPAVQRLKSAIDAAGITTWFDLDRLEGGDDYDRKIRNNIARCSFFVPVISATTQRRHEAYFRREWSYAVDRSRSIAEGAVFILPVCIDDTPEAGRARPREVPGPAHHAHAAAASRRAGIPAARSKDLLQRASRMSSPAGRSRRVDRDRPGATPWLGPVCPTRRKRAPTSTVATTRRRSSHAASSARTSRCCSASPASARRRCCAPGLVPRLRREGFCPVYVRVDYNPDSPSPSSRSSRRSSSATAAAGHWIEPGHGHRGRVAVGVPSPPRRPAARRRAAARCCRC